MNKNITYCVASKCNEDKKKNCLRNLEAFKKEAERDGSNISVSDFSLEKENECSHFWDHRTYTSRYFLGD